MTTTPNPAERRCLGQTRFPNEKKARKAIARAAYEEDRRIPVREIWHCQHCHGVHVSRNANGAAA